MKSQQELVNEDRKPIPDLQVRRLFDLQGFMPQPLAVHDDEEDGLTVLESSSDVVARAIVFDYKLASAALRNGELPLCNISKRLLTLCSGYTLTCERTEQNIEGWLDYYEKTEVLEFVDVSDAPITA